MNLRQQIKALIKAREYKTLLKLFIPVIKIDKQFFIMLPRWDKYGFYTQSVNKWNNKKHTDKIKNIQYFYPGN